MNALSPAKYDRPRAADVPDGPVLIEADKIKIEPVQWVWNGWLAAKKFHLLGGSPGNGKTTIALKIAATISAGNMWPDHSRAPKGKVVIWSGEDGIDDTLAPRLKACGADLSNISFVECFRTGNSERAFDPAEDMNLLLRRLELMTDLKLLILDPVVTAIAGESHRNAEVRRGLQPLVYLAERTGCAVLGITHFSKGTAGRDPVERLTGSLAFGALARIVWVAAKGETQQSDTDRIFCRAKSNLGPDTGGFRYRLDKVGVPGTSNLEASAIEWLAPVEGHARDLLAAKEIEPSKPGALEEAKKFLLELLSEGPLSAQTVRDASDRTGHSWATVRRASQALGTQTRKDGMKGGWRWHLDRSRSSDIEDALDFG